MVNFIKLCRSLLHGLLKMAGLRRHTVEIQPGTTMCFLIPKEKLKKKKTTETYKKDKPAVVLLHGFFADGTFTWLFQVGLLASKYSVYVPDLLFFGDSTTDSEDRSPKFQAECLTRALEKLGVKKCTVVGFSYGGVVAFKMAELRPDIVGALVVTGSVVEFTDSVLEATVGRLGYSSSSEMLLPESTKALRVLLRIGSYKKLWFPNILLKDFLEVMFNNRKEKAELLEGSVITDKDAIVPGLQQRVLMLWGENDNVFNLELGNNTLAELGERATLQIIEKAGHLAHLERPCVYTRHLKDFLVLVNSHTDEGNKDSK